MWSGSLSVKKSWSAVLSYGSYAYRLLAGGAHGGKAKTIGQH